MTKIGTIGYVGAFPIPEVVAGINSYFLGAQSVNPGVKIKVVWVNSWYDPAKEADAAKALLDQGVDVIAQHTDSPAPAAAGGRRAASSASARPPTWSASPRRRSSRPSSTTGRDYYVERTKAVLDGTWKSGDTWGGLAAGMVVMAPYKNMPDDVKKPWPRRPRPPSSPASSTPSSARS